MKKVAQRQVFQGDYPTPGGNKVVNRSFINFIEGINKRAY